MFISLKKYSDGYYIKLFGDSDDAKLLDQFFQERHIYNYTGKYVIPEKRIFEFELWFQRFGFTYEFEGDSPVIKEPEQETKFFRREIFDPSVTTRQLKNYQLDLLDWGVKRNRHLIVDEPGLGKTLQSLCLWLHFYKQDKTDSLVLLVKKNLPYQWKYEILNSTDLVKEEDIKIVTNENKVRAFDNQSKKIIIIQNHIWADLVLSYRQKDHVKNKSRLRWNKPYFDLLKVWGKKNPYLIIDECHEYKSPDAVKSESLRPYLEFFQFRTLLSATPAINSFLDYWNQLNIVDPNIIPFDYNSFVLTVAQDIGIPRNAFAVTKYDEKRVLEFKQRMALNVIKRRKCDIPEIKTERIIKPIRFEMSQKHRQIYEMIQEQEIKRLWRDEKDKLRIKDIQHKFPYSILCIDNPGLLNEKIISEPDMFRDDIQKHISHWKPTYDNKILYLDDYLKEHIEEGKEKVIIFDYHPLTMEVMLERYKKYDPVIIHGQIKGDTDEHRQVKINRFNDKDDSCKLAIFSIFIASAGYNLNKGGCRRIIYYSLPYDAIPFRQSLDRTDRADSDRDSLIEVLLYGESLDEFRYNVLNSRVEFNDEFLNKDLKEFEIYNIFKKGKL